MLSTLPSAVEREIYGGHAAQTAGVSPETMALEVKKAFQQRLRKEKKKQERRDLAPAVNQQPQTRELRYENIRSALAEEGVIRLLLLDPGLAGEMWSQRISKRPLFRLGARGWASEYPRVTRDKNSPFSGAKASRMTGP